MPVAYVDNPSVIGGKQRIVYDEAVGIPAAFTAGGQTAQQLMAQNKAKPVVQVQPSQSVALTDALGAKVPVGVKPLGEGFLPSKYEAYAESAYYNYNQNNEIIGLTIQEKGRPEMGEFGKTTFIPRKELASEREKYYAAEAERQRFLLDYPVGMSTDKGYVGFAASSPLVSSIAAPATQITSRLIQTGTGPTLPNLGRPVTSVAPVISAKPLVAQAKGGLYTDTLKSRAITALKNRKDLPEEAKAPLIKQLEQTPESEFVKAQQRYEKSNEGLIGEPGSQKRLGLVGTAGAFLISGIPAASAVRAPVTGLSIKRFIERAPPAGEYINSLVDASRGVPELFGGGRGPQYVKGLVKARTVTGLTSEGKEAVAIAAPLKESYKKFPLDVERAPAASAIGRASQSIKLTEGGVAQNIEAVGPGRISSGAPGAYTPADVAGVTGAARPGGGAYTQPVVNKWKPPVEWGTKTTVKQTPVAFETSFPFSSIKTGEPNIMLASKLAPEYSPSAIAPESFGLNIKQGQTYANVQLNEFDLSKGTLVNRLTLKYPQAEAGLKAAQQKGYNEWYIRQGAPAGSVRPKGAGTPLKFTSEPVGVLDEAAKNVKANEARFGEVKLTPSEAAEGNARLKEMIEKYKASEETARRIKDFDKPIPFEGIVKPGGDVATVIKPPGVEPRPIAYYIEKPPSTSPGFIPEIGRVSYFEPPASGGTITAWGGLLRNAANERSLDKLKDLGGRLPITAQTSKLKDEGLYTPYSGKQTTGGTQGTKLTDATMQFNKQAQSFIPITDTGIFEITAPKPSQPELPREGGGGGGSETPGKPGRLSFLGLPTLPGGSSAGGRRAGGKFRVGLGGAYRPSLAGMLSGITVTKAAKSLTGGEIRYPIASKPRGRIIKLFLGRKRR